MAFIQHDVNWEKLRNNQLRHNQLVLLDWIILKATLSSTTPLEIEALQVEDVSLTGSLNHDCRKKNVALRPWQYTVRWVTLQPPNSSYLQKIGGGQENHFCKKNSNTRNKLCDTKNDRSCCIFSNSCNLNFIEFKIPKTNMDTQNDGPWKR